VAEAVAHQLEAIDVEEEHTDTGRARGRRCNGLIERREEPAAVRKPGQHVVRNHVCLCLLVLFAFGDVGTHRDDPDLYAFVVEDRRIGQEDGYLGSVFARRQEVTRPRLAG
jgi:hypothetical protein